MSQASLVTPIGTIVVEADGEVLKGLRIGEGISAPSSAGLPILTETLAQLSAWFAGTLQIFDLPLTGPATPRGAAHRAAIEEVGYGQTVSYGQIARGIGSSPRAVGQACARNPFPLIVPCHRVLGAGGTIGHYSAGTGVATKRWLLSFENGRTLWAA